MKNTILAVAVAMAATVPAFSFAGTTAAANQAVITQLQSQIKSVQASINPAVQAQAAVTKKEIASLQQQVQVQIKNLQGQIQQLETQLTAEIQKVANEK